MAIRKIVKVGDPTLRRKSRQVTAVDARTIALLDDMAETMRDSQGVGLAAPQVGVLRRVVVADAGEGLMELINPVLLDWSGKQTGPEGCLSVPDRSEEMTRPMYVTVEAMDRNGERFLVKASGLLARCLCHEIDHLDGTLYIDYADGNAIPAREKE